MRLLSSAGLATALLATALAAVASAENARVTARRANIRKGPDVSAPLLASVAEGTILEVVGQEGDWYKVQVPEGTGYIYGPLVEVEAPPEEAPDAAGAEAPPAEAASATGVAIDHAPVGCVVAERYPVLEACFDPAGAVSRARVGFRAAGTPFWYYVDMKPGGNCYQGTLPKPKKSTKKIEYYVEAVDRTFNESRTQDYDPVVVGNATQCRDRLVAGALGSASVVVGAAPGAPVLPGGFLPGGLVAAGSPAGAAGAASEGGAASGSGAGAGGAAGAGAATGGGLALGTIGLVAGGAAALAGVALAVSGGEEDPLDRDEDRDGVTPRAGDCNDSDPSINPNGTVAFSSARFESVSSTCPNGGTNAGLSFAVVADGRNNRCAALTITSVTATITVTAASNTTNTPGQSFDFPNVPFSPSSIPSAGQTAVRVPIDSVCTNPRRNAEGFTELRARLTFVTSAGTFTAETSNLHRVIFPFR